MIGKLLLSFNKLLLVKITTLANIQIPGHGKLETEYKMLLSDSSTASDLKFYSTIWHGILKPINHHDDEKA